jgi:hypothetical protein
MGKRPFLLLLFEPKKSATVPVPSRAREGLPASGRCIDLRDRSPKRERGDDLFAPIKKSGTVAYRPWYVPSKRQRGSMRFSSVLDFHICAGTLGLLSGARSHVFPQGFPPASRSWKRILHINAEHVRSRGIHGVYEIPNGQCFRRRSDVLSGGNGMGHRKAP